MSKFFGKEISVVLTASSSAKSTQRGCMVRVCWVRCLIFAQLPFAGGSLAVLKVFCELTGIALDLHELEQQTEELGKRLGELLAQVEGEIKEETGTAPEEEAAEPEPSPKLSEKAEQSIEALFDQARKDRSKAYELKQELDPLNAFADYEDRFLDLFHQPESQGDKSSTKLMTIDDSASSERRVSYRHAELRLVVDDPEHGMVHQFVAILASEFVTEFVAVGVDRVRTDMQLFGDVTRGDSLADQAIDLKLPVCQPRHGFFAVTAAESLTDRTLQDVLADKPSPACTVRIPSNSFVSYSYLLT
jgi:hypothetical protein